MPTQLRRHGVNGLRHAAAPRHIASGNEEQIGSRPLGNDIANLGRRWLSTVLFVIIMPFLTLFQANAQLRDWQQGFSYNKILIRGGFFQRPKPKGNTGGRKGESLDSSFFPCGTNRSNRELGFLHIPKTGGSSIEEAVKTQTKTSWGYFAWTQKRWNEHLDTKFRSPEYKPVKYVFWHLPPSIVSLVITNTSIPYKDQDLFATIRNPFTRIASEVRYRCDLLRHQKAKEKCLETTRVNTYLQNTFTKVLNGTRELESSTMDPKALQDFLRKGHHFVPQWQFFYNHFSGERQARYLLHFENIAEDFQDLMESYSLNISLATHERKRQTNYSDVEPGKFRDMKDFDETTQRLLVELYRKDFELGGYSLNISDVKSYSLPSHVVDPNSRTFWELPCRMRL